MEDRSATLISHARQGRTPRAVAPLPTAVVLAATFARLVAAVGITTLLSADDFAATGAAIALAAITAHADREHSATARGAAGPDSQDRFTVPGRSVHSGIMPKSMMGR